MKIYAAVAMTGLACSGVLGEVVRWINPAGGDFDVGSNWDRGTPPGAMDVPRFDLAATYTVTLSGNRQFDGLQIGGSGNPMIIMNGMIYLGVPGLTGYGSGLAISGSVRLKGGTLVVGNGTAIVHGGPIIAEGTVITDKVAGGSSNSQGLITGEVRGLVVVVRRTNVNGQMYSCRFGGERVYLVGGAMIGGSAGGGEGTHVTGPFNIAGGASVGGGSQEGFQVHAPLIVEGEGTALTGFLRIMAGTTKVRAGGSTSNYPVVLVGTSALHLEAGGVVLGRIEPIGTSTLRIEAGSSGPAPLMVSPASGTFNPSVEVVIDGAHLGGWSSRMITTGSGGYGSRLSVEIANSNALRIGDSVRLFHSDWLMEGNFTSITTPVLGGGRAAEVTVEPRQVTLNIIAGGSPCWPADFDGDGSDGTEQDIEAFFACLAGRCCALCGSADFNSDGDTGTDQDIEAFFRVLAGGAC